MIASQSGKTVTQTRRHCHEIVDRKNFFEGAKTSDGQNIFVEMDPKTFGPCAEYLIKI
jgi:hypothetical protein